MIKTLMAKGLKGDTRASGVLINLKLGLDQIEGAKHPDEMLSSEDEAIVARFSARACASANAEEDRS